MLSAGIISFLFSLFVLLSDVSKIVQVQSTRTGSEDRLIGAIVLLGCQNTLALYFPPLHVSFFK